MHVERFTDQYGLAASVHGMSGDELRERDARRGQEPERWLALRADDAAGAVTVAGRPDGRVFLTFACPDKAAYGPLTEAVAATRRGPLHTRVDADAAEAVAALGAAGFAPELLAEDFRACFDVTLARLRRASVPRGFSIHGADAVDEGRLFTLDVAIRNDVPGTNGWRGDRRWFHDELSGDPAFDPAGYRVAIDDASGEYVGLARIWNNPSGPRFGLIGVLRHYRSTRIAAALLRQALDGAAAWGHASFTAETANPVLRRKLVRLGAESLGRSYQLVRRAR